MIITCLLALFVTISIALAFYAIRLRKERIEVISLNEERQRENERIEQSIYQNKVELDSLKTAIESKQSILSNQESSIRTLQDTEKELQQNAENRANEYYSKRISEIDNELLQHHAIMVNHYAKELADVAVQIEDQQDKLKALKDKQTAYIEAQKRQLEMESRKDYYSLVLSDLFLEDIQLLRGIQYKFNRKEIIDKLIWEMYYKSAYDNLIARLFDTSQKKVSGIYKITDTLTRLPYIGQSVDIKERFRQHIKSALSYGVTSNKLYQQMKKSGLQNFTFEILEEVPKDKLNEREVYWIDFYKTKEFGLNGTKGGA